MTKSCGDHLSLISTLRFLIAGVQTTIPCVTRLRRPSSATFRLQIKQKPRDPLSNYRILTTNMFAKSQSHPVRFAAEISIRQRKILVDRVESLKLVLVSKPKG